MRRGTKRKAPALRAKKYAEAEEESHNEPNKASEVSQEEPSRSAEENHKEPSQAAAKEQNHKAGGRRAKWARIARPETEPEYFEEKRNLEDLWKEVFPVGTEWEQLDLVHKYNWSFRNLEEAFEEGGELFGKKVYLFAGTEPQWLYFRGEGNITIIPVVVAIVSPFPPSDKIGINSVQREREEIVPMKQMKMDWVPYIPLENRESQVERLKSQIFILGCTQRRASLRHLRIERVKKFEYCLPYLYDPFKVDEEEENTVVPIIFSRAGDSDPLVCDFDWELDDLEEFTDDLIEKEQLVADQKDAFKEFVKENVREAKKKIREAREARRRTLEEMSEEVKAAYRNMKFYKFYPVQTPDVPDFTKEKSSFINRYYGRAHKVF